MKTRISLIGLFLILLASCNNVSQPVETTPIIIKVEVTKIVQITTTPIPTASTTPSPTLRPFDVIQTTVADEIGTPIVASRECYETAQTQSEINQCAAERMQKLRKKMDELLNIMEKHYQRYSQVELEKIQEYHMEWENLSERECSTRAGYDSDGWVGTMASSVYGECMISKYEDRLREYQIQIFEWSY